MTLFAVITFITFTLADGATTTEQIALPGFSAFESRSLCEEAIDIAADKLEEGIESGSIAIPKNAQRYDYRAVCEPKTAVWAPATTP